MSQVELNFEAQDPPRNAQETQQAIHSEPHSTQAPPTLVRTNQATRPANEWHKHPEFILRGRKLQLIASILMALALTLGLYLLMPLWMRYWAFALGELMNWLPLDEARLSSQSLAEHRWLNLSPPAIKLWLDTPNTHDWLGHLGGASLLALLAGFLGPTLRSALRALAVFHMLTVVTQGLLNPFSFTVEEHTRSLSLMSIGILLCMPCVMAMTHYIIERSHEKRLLASLLIAAWLIISLPFKLVAHVALLSQTSLLSMPTLYMVFGPALDIMIVSALYAWTATWRHSQA